MNNKIVVIGGLNLDICHHSKNKLMLTESNIGSIDLFLGGVGYNIFKNLSNLNLDVDFMSSIGDDNLSYYVLSLLKQQKINLDMIKINHNTHMPIYSYILENNDMYLAINDMEAINKLDIDFIKINKKLLDKAKYIVIDTNLSQSLIEFLCINYSNKIFVDGVSYIKVKKLKNVLKYIHTIKVNKNELASLLELNSLDDKDIFKAINLIVKQGVKNIFVSNGANGIYYNDGQDLKRVINKRFDVINSNGAGDALASGIFYSIVNNLNKSDQVLNGLRLVKYTLLTNSSTSDLINEKILKGG